MRLRDLFRARPTGPTDRRVGQSDGGGWIPAGKSFWVAGREIGGGMVFAGRHLRSVHGHQPEPALIDPTLKVNWRRPDVSGRRMTYWPSYSSIEPESRAAYLQWLAGGRSDRHACIGYVFLFFYGLERRVLVDAKLDPTQEDVTAAVAEVERLLGLYGRHDSFARYASEFLELVRAGDLVRRDLSPNDIVTPSPSWQLPLALRVGVARHAAQGEPLPAEWALAWLRAAPDAYLRTPADRCEAEFDSLFLATYRRRFPTGLPLRRTSARIELDYRPASASFHGSVEVTLEDLPDVTSSEPQFADLRDVAEECADALGAYSRYLGRRPDSAGTPEAIALLPPELLRAHGGSPVARLERFVGELLAGSDFATGALDDLVASWSPELAGEKLNKAQSVGLASVLAKLGFGMEPDVRFGAPKPKPGEDVVLFRLPADAPSAPSPGYTDAALLVRLSGLLAAADGTVSDEERRMLAEHLEESVGLEPPERARVEASLLWVGATRQQFGGLRKRLESLSESDRGALAHFLTDVAAADGNVSPEEITALVKLYGLLGLDEAAAYSAVHAREVGDDAPITVRPADPDPGRRIIPTQTEERGAQIDPARLAARRAETAQVAALLGSVFAEEEGIDSPVVSGPDNTPADSSLPGLDASHAALALMITRQSTWSVNDLEQVASDYSIQLVDAAVDRINDAVFEICGELLLDGDGPWEVNTYACEEMT